MVILSRCANEEGTRQKSQERLKSDLGLRLFGFLARKNNKHSGVKWVKHGNHGNCFR